MSAADLDPTNDMLADTRHVTLAIARDYSDVPLLHGVDARSSSGRRVPPTAPG